MNKQSIKCINCGHVIFYDENPPFGDKPEWRHKHMLHDDNCECREPIPDFRLLELIKIMDEIIENHKNEPYDYSRGWNSMTFEEQHRPFTI